MMSLPQNMGSSVAELARLVDEMWYLTGDRSVDFSWYTKRAVLSTVYASTGSLSAKTANGRGLHDDRPFRKF